MQMAKSKWFLPFFSVALGLAIHASAIAGTAVILAIIIGFLVEMARGHNGSPFTWLGAIGGLTYMAAIIVMHLRG